MMSFMGRPDKRPRLASFLLFSAIACAGTILAYFRVPPLTARTLWAEDGQVFLHEYLDQGPGLLNPYDGYLHLLPRFIVAVVTPVFGIEAYSLAVTVACSIVLGLVAALTFYCGSAVTQNPAVRLGWASIPVLVAPGALETMANLANLHWYLLWLAPWVLMKSPSGPGQKVLLAASALIIGLSEIQAALFLPLLLFRLRDKSLWWAKAALAAGAGCQFYTLWRFPRISGGTGEPGDLLSIIYGYFLNTSAALFYGNSHAVREHVQDFGALPIVLSAVPFALAVFLLARFGDRMQRTTGAVWLLASGALWTAAVVINPAPYFYYSQLDSPGSWAGFFLSRYSTVPSMFLLALIPLLVARPSGNGAAPGRVPALLRSSRFRWGVLGAFIVLQAVHYFPTDAARSSGPLWAEQVRSARQSCNADPTLESVQILEAPEGWAATLRCEDL
ncbi:hypothetical protein [Arthrobacter yangruifuii]|uniref:hypothetical protein n=1 Tax=Arthrobacter yangruifuii TaxID=2606616 RepID=UPI0011B415B7|nr:hypothetical protein [Arthrobacter yangruifuii]